MPDVVNQLMNLMIGWIVVKEERIGTKSVLETVAQNLLLDYVSS